VVWLQLWLRLWLPVELRRQTAAPCIAGRACGAAAFGAVACVELQQLELSLQLLSLRLRSAALEEALAVASPGSAACPRQAAGKLAGASLQCQGAIAGGSVYSRPYGRP
jgi:hypothetical protein